MKATITGKSYFGKIGDTVEVVAAEGATLEILQSALKGKWFGIIPKGFGGPVCWTHESHIRLEHDERADAFEWLRSQALAGNQHAAILIDDLWRLKDYDDGR